MVSNFIPNWPVPPINTEGGDRYLFPSYATKKIARAQQGRKQTTSDQHTVGSSYASGFGVKLFRGEKGKNQIRAKSKLIADEKVIKQARVDAKNAKRKGDLTKKEYKERLLELNERLVDLYKDFAERMKFIKEGKLE